MRTLKLTLTYDGSAFHGWQVQPGKPTIQGTLAEVIFDLTGERLLPQGSGRTDAGVHALAQIATFITDSRIPTANFRTVLNDRLPSAIRVLACDEMPEGFHARHSAHSKRYHYRIWRGEVVPPFLARYVTHHPYPLDEGAMQQAAALVAGEHDFTSFAATDPDRTARLAEEAAAFAAADCAQPDTAAGTGIPQGNIRLIHESRFERHGDELLYLVHGSGFLHHMVRNLVGTFLLVGKGTIAPAEIIDILNARDRRAAGATAPPEGLYLVAVDY